MTTVLKKLKKAIITLKNKIKYLMKQADHNKTNNNDYSPHRYYSNLYNKRILIQLYASQ